MVVFTFKTGKCLSCYKLHCHRMKADCSSLDKMSGLRDARGEGAPREHVAGKAFCLSTVLQ